MQNVDGHASRREAADDSTRPAADVEHRPLAGDEIHHVPVARPLPVALEEDATVVSAVVVVGGKDGIPEQPQLAERPQPGHADLQHSRL